MSSWRNLFQPQILQRGLDYFQGGAVRDLERHGDDFTATVEGSSDYYVGLTISNGNVTSPVCTCPYAREHGTCKHIAAVLYAIEDKYTKGVFAPAPAPERKKNSSPVRDKYTTLTFEDDGSYHYLNFGKSLDVYKPTKSDCEKALAWYKDGDFRNADVSRGGTASDKELSYSVRVEDSEKEGSTLVTIALGRNGIRNISCTRMNPWFYSTSILRPECRIFAADKNGIYQLCVHKTVALLSLFDFLHENRDYIDFSDNAALEFINNFRKTTKKKTGSEKSEETIVDIEPTLFWNSLKLSLKVSGSNGKFYKVRDAGKFIKTVTQRELHSLNKDSAIDFSTARLTERAERVMKVLESAELQNLVHRYTNTWDKDFLYIGWALDDFFSDIEDGDVLLSGGEKLTLSPSRPSFTMRIDDRIEDGKRLGVTVSGNITKGRESQRYLYWCEGNTLYRGDKNELGAAAQFLKSADSSGSFLFTVGMGLIDRFYQNVLPELRKAGKIEDNAIDKLEGILKEPPTAIFYVEAIKDYVVCSALFRYDGKENTLYPSYSHFNDLRSNLCPEFQSEISDFLDSVFKGNYSADGLWILSESVDDVYSFYNEGLESLSEMGELFVTDEVKSVVVKKMPPVKSTLDIDEKNDSVLNFTLDLQGLSVEELVAILESYKRRKKFHRLKSGDFISLEGVCLDALCDIFLSSGLSIKDFTEGKMHLPLYRALYLDQILKEQNGVTYEGGQRLRRLIKEFKTISESDYEVPSSLDGTMRSYQKDGYRWMRVLLEHGFGGILADDMGLGKTIQALSLLLALKEEGKSVNALIVSPASLVYNWKAECTKFTPSLNAVTVTGTAKEREHIIKGHDKYDILITSYDLLKRDIALYENASFNIEIIDEAQFIKNHNTAQAKAVRAVKSTHRLALTGTPIENRLSELWSIFEYLMPGFLFSQESFKKLLSNPIEKNGDREAAERLRKLTGPFILRRLKSDVLKDLPEKTEETRVTPLQGEQLRLYTAEVAKAKGMLKGSENYNEKKIEILAELMRIREICCDPALVFQDYRGESAKREAVMDLIVSAIDGAHKILLFSQFTSMLELLEKDLGKEGISYYKITGDTGKAKRLELVDAFNSGTVPLFLISLKAGGTGLNLTAADIVIHYDPWWNTAVQNQATDRAHRIGQTKRVTVYKMIAENTIEEKIMRLQETKKNLADEIVSTENISLSTLSKEDLMDLLSISKMG